VKAFAGHQLDNIDSKKIPLISRARQTGRRNLQPFNWGSAILKKKITDISIRTLAFYQNEVPLHVKIHIY